MAEKPTSPNGYTEDDLVILVPMLGRSHRVEPLLASIRRTVPGARVLFCCTPGDRGVLDAVTGTGAEHIVVPGPGTGDYARKINAGYRATHQALLFTGADDLEFHTGWFAAAAAALADPAIGVVGTNDLHHPRVLAGEHSTHSLVTRAYADRYGLIDESGKILYEGYVHEWVDDELVGTARFRGAYVHAPDAHVEHLHPNWDTTVPTDPLYRRQRVRIRTSAPLFRHRRRLWT